MLIIERIGNNGLKLKLSVLWQFCNSYTNPSRMMSLKIFGINRVYFTKIGHILYFRRTTLRKTVVLRTQLSQQFDYLSSIQKLSIALLVCISTSSDTSSRLFGSIPNCPDTYIRPRQIVAVEYGPIAFGPIFVLKVSIRGFICCQILILTQGQQQQMIEVHSLTPLFEKIRSLCKECRNVPMPNRLQNGTFKIQQYVEALQLIRNQIIRFRELEEDYHRLQIILQSQEATLRNKVGTEQQMKLYTESLKSHINQLSLEKLQLLQNSKEAIKQMKRVNEDLYSQLDSLKKGSAVKGRTSSLKAQSDKKVDLNLIGIKDIVKTEYFDRSISQQEAIIKKSKPISHSFRLSEEPGKGIQFRQNSKTYQVIQPKTDRELITTSKKRQLSNFCPYIKVSKKQHQQQLKFCYLTKDNEKNKKLKTKVKNVNRSLWKDKMANRSVASVGSMQAVSSQIQTL